MLGVALVATAALGLLCFGRIVRVMFREGDAERAVLVLTLTLLCGTGLPVAFVVGWRNVRRWRAWPTMVVWTGCLLCLSVLVGLAREQWADRAPAPPPENRSIPAIS